ALPEGIVPERSLWGAAKNSLKVGGAAPAKCYRPPGSGFHRALICVAPIYGIDLSSCCCLSSAVGLSSVSMRADHLRSREENLYCNHFTPSSRPLASRVRTRPTLSVITAERAEGLQDHQTTDHETSP